MATPSMSMNKVIHCAVRRDLKRFRAALDSFQDGDKERAAGLHRAWENFDTQLTHHHEGEHEIAWPALLAVGVDQAAITTFDEEHDAMAAALRRGRHRDGRPRRVRVARGRRRRGDRDGAPRAGHGHPPRQRGGDERAALRREARRPGDQGDGQEVRQAAASDGRACSSPGSRTAPVAEEMAALKAEVPAPVMALLPLLFGRRYRKEVAPVWATSGSH